MFRLLMRILVYIISFSGSIMFIGWLVMNFMGAHTIYDMKLKYELFMESVANSPVLGAALYFGSALAAFVGVILVVMVLIMLLRR